MTGLFPDYALIIIGSNMGVSKMTKEHLGIAVVLKVPFILVITKIDLCPQNVMDETMKTIKMILKNANVNKIPIEI